MDTYEVRNHRTFRITDDGNEEQLSNFNAEISEEVKYIDGKKQTTFLTLKGTVATDEESGRKLPPIQIEASRFPALSWILEEWGSEVVVFPGANNVAQLRAAIQLAARPKKTTVYTSIGWQEVGKKRVYLHASGGIDASGLVNNVQVELPSDLARYTFEGIDDKAARGTLTVLQAAPPDIAWPLLGAVLVPLHGEADFAVHLSGRTGTFKSEYTSLFQSHYGAGMDARHLPANWSSTANAIEALAYRARNALMTIDDFVPTGTSWQVRALQKTADQIVRAQGNQAGRARLTDVSGMQQTMYPRGLILSTGEDIPEGHSIRARMLILDLTPGDIVPQKLTAAQAKREELSNGLAAYIAFLADHPERTEAVNVRAKQIRDANLSLGHTRTPSMVGRLIAVIEDWLYWVYKHARIISLEQEGRLRREMTAAIQAAGKRQLEYLEQTDPSILFVQAIREILGKGAGHVRGLSGGVPAHPDLLGWTEEEARGEMRTWKAHGRTIGWIDWENDEFYLDVVAAWADLKRASGNALSMTQQTTLKRLKDAGALIRTDDARSRNTVRITADGRTRVVAVLSASETFQNNEVPQDAPGDAYEEPEPETEIATHDDGGIA